MYSLDRFVEIVNLKYKLKSLLTEELEFNAQNDIFFINEEHKIYVKFDDEKFYVWADRYDLPKTESYYNTILENESENNTEKDFMRNLINLYK